MTERLEVIATGVRHGDGAAERVDHGPDAVQDVRQFACGTSGEGVRRQLRSDKQPFGPPGPSASVTSGAAA
ncbi:hypothetical protein [Streptomyces sp. NPDC102282]|uniref:hypothetical protein n=1 Tax=Streptomyces sp. NPDC102282 TaxID=3366154 RepID=UPI00381C91B7